MRLDQMVNMSHELIILAKEVDWNWIESELKDSYSEEGRPSIPIRTMVGMLLLKQLHNQSDESVLARWVENPYWQYFLPGNNIFNINHHLIQQILCISESGLVRLEWKRY